MSFCLRPNVCKKCGKPLTMFEGWTCLECENAEQQHCEDVISREAAIKAVYGMTRYTGIDEAPYEYAEHVISDLPSVTPKPTEDAISIRKDALKTRVGNIVAYNVEWLKKHWQMEMEIVCGVKPCEDAISREAVLDLCDSKDPDYKVRHFKEDVECLPPVTPSCDKCAMNGSGSKYCDNCKPSRPKGHWINVNEGKWNTIPAYKCSACGENADLRDWSGKSPFCPWCGAEMVEPQESEE